VAVGYLAIDLPIMPDGMLGRRVSTLGLLESGREPTLGEHLGPQSHLTGKIAYDVYRWLKGGQEPAAKRLVDRMGLFAADMPIPADLRFYGIVGNPPKAAVNDKVNASRMKDLEADKQNKTFARFKSYSTLLLKSIDALSRYGSPDKAAELASPDTSPCSSRTRMKYSINDYYNCFCQRRNKHTVIFGAVISCPGKDDDRFLRRHIGRYSE